MCWGCESIIERIWDRVGEVMLFKAKGKDEKIPKKPKKKKKKRRKIQKNGEGELEGSGKLPGSSLLVQHCGKGQVC